MMPQNFYQQLSCQTKQKPKVSSAQMPSFFHPYAYLMGSGQRDGEIVGRFDWCRAHLLPASLVPKASINVLPYVIIPRWLEERINQQIRWYAQCTTKMIGMPGSKIKNDVVFASYQPQLYAQIILHEFKHHASHLMPGINQRVWAYTLLKVEDFYFSSDGKALMSAIQCSPCILSKKVYWQRQVQQGQVTEATYQKVMGHPFALESIHDDAPIMIKPTLKHYQFWVKSLNIFRQKACESDRYVWLDVKAFMQGHACHGVDFAQSSISWSSQVSVGHLVRLRRMLRAWFIKCFNFKNSVALGKAVQARCLSIRDKQPKLWKKMSKAVQDWLSHYKTPFALEGQCKQGAMVAQMVCLPKRMRMKGESQANENHLRDSWSVASPILGG